MALKAIHEVLKVSFDWKTVSTLYITLDNYHYYRPFTVYIQHLSGLLLLIN